MTRSKHFFLISVLSCSTIAYAAPPEGANPLYKPYYEGLRTKEGWGCCSIADCRTVRVRYEGKQPWVFIDKETFGSTAPDDWVKVPNSALSTYNEHPEAPRPQQAIACWYQSQIRCFDTPLTEG